MALPVAKWRFDVDAYHRMAESGILAPNDSVELIDGEVLHMSPMGSRHAACVDRLLHTLFQPLAGRAIVRCQSPIRLNRHNEPEPDLTLLRPREDFYATAHPSAEDVLWVIEVSDSSLDFDRQVKLPLYAQFGIPEVWILDLGSDQILIHGQPSGLAYAEQRTHGGGETFTTRAFPDLQLSVDSLIP